LQLCRLLRLPEILAIRHHVVQMLYAKNVMVLGHVHAYQNTQATHIQAVGQSVFSIQIAIEQELVLGTSVWILVLVPVASMQSVV
jgi:hypothetical protein